MPRVRLESTDPFATAASIRFGWIPETQSACPEVEEIHRAVDQDRGITETRELVDHLSGCPACFHEWRRARATRWGMVLASPATVS